MMEAIWWLAWAGVCDMLLEEEEEEESEDG